MALAAKFEITGLRDITDRLARAGARARSGLAKPGKLVGEEMLVRTHTRLAQGLDVHGGVMKSKAAERDGHRPLVASGKLSNSVHYGADAGGVDLYSSDPRAGVHYRGDVITPKRAKWLTIPLRARGGEDPAGDVDVAGNRTGRRAAHYKNTFFLRKNGKLLLMQKTGRGTIRALFLLVKRVKLPQNEWLGWSESDLEMSAEVYGNYLDTFKDGGA